MEHTKNRVGLNPFDFDLSVRRHGIAMHAERLQAKGLAPLQLEAERVDAMGLRAGGLGWRFDFTKQLLDDEAWEALQGVAEDADWRAIAAQFAGEPINETEGRAVLAHGPEGEPEMIFKWLGSL